MSVGSGRRIERKMESVKMPEVTHVIESHCSPILPSMFVSCGSVTLPAARLSGSIISGMFGSDTTG